MMVREAMLVERANKMGIGIGRYLSDQTFTGKRLAVRAQ